MDVVNVLFEIVEQNKNNLECLIDVYQLTLLDQDQPCFWQMYKQVVLKYPHEKLKTNFRESIKKVVAADEKALQKLAEITFDKPKLESVLRFYIPYLMWEMIDSANGIKKEIQKKKI